MEDVPLTRALLLVGLGALSGCGPSGKAKFVVEGSLGAIMDMGYDRAVIETSPDDVSLRFVRERGVAEDTPLKVVWAFAGETFNPPATLDLAQPRPDDSMRPRGALGRNVENDPRMNFPNIVRGSLVLYAAPMPGAKVKAEFRATLSNGTDPSSGRTAFATVIAEVP